MRPKWFQLLALMLPLVVIGVGVVRGERLTQTGVRWEFAIDGYDPRDPLRGQYLLFRMELQPENSKGTSEPCACLVSQGPNDPPVVSPISCEDAPTACDHFVDLEALRSIRRFYIPEAHASDLEGLLRKAARDGTARAAVMIDTLGHPTLVDVLVAGVPILDQVRAPRPTVPSTTP